jgi:Bacterial regulatory proteins, luxR family
LQIARLVAAGLTNKKIAERLYLSPRTVSGHLYRVFPKLEITSRAALRAALQALPDHADAGAPTTELTYRRQWWARSAPSGVWSPPSELRSRACMSSQATRPPN